MFNPRAKRIGPGVYCLDNIRERCRIDPITDCWVWSMAVSDGGGRAAPDAARVGAEGRAEHRTPDGVGAARGLAHVGPAAGSRHVVWRTCGCELCVNPAHLQAGTKAEEGAWMRERPQAGRPQARGREHAQRC